MAVKNEGLKDLEVKRAAGKQEPIYAVATVDHVIDGDTFDITSGNPTRIRLQGVNSPEKNTPEGKAAIQGLKALLAPGATVRMRNLETQEGTGNFSARTVALVYVGNTLVNEAIVRDGWAVPTEHIFKVPTPEAQRIVRAMEDAKNAKRGLWKLFPQSEFLKPFNLIQDLPEFPEIDRLERLGTIPGATKIGTIWLYVPPTQFTVVDRNANMEIPLIRAPGSARFKSSQQEQRIEMYVIFPNTWAVNYQFRPLLAQFMRSPFLPIRNKDLEDLLLPTYALADDFVTDEPAGETGKKKNQAAKSVRNDATKAGVSPFAKPMENVNAGDFAELPAAAVRRPSQIKVKDRQLFATLRNMVVSTVPGKPHGLQVTFILSVFNYLPHSSKVEYLKTDGDVVKQALYFEKVASLKFPDGDAAALEDLKGLQTTNDISQCEPFRKYYRTLLAESNIPSIQDQLQWRRGATPRLMPFLQERAENITMRMKISLFPDEKVAQNQMNIQNLSQEIEELLRDEIMTENLSPLRQLTRSAINWAGLFVEFFTTYIPKKIENAGKIISESNIIVLQAGEYFRDGNTAIITSLREELGSNTSTAASIFADVAGRTLRNPRILEIMKQVLKVEDANRMGVQEEIMVHIKTGKDTVISGINASYSPMVVPIPVIAHLTPSMQVMGKSDWVISISIQTCSRALVQQLMDLSQKSRLTRMALEKTERWYLQKFNSIEVGLLDWDSNGFFNVLGITRVLVEDFTHETVQGKPGWFNLSFRLVQADLDISDYERLVRDNFLSGASTKQILQNIKTGNIPNTNRTYNRINQVLERATRQSVRMAFQGVFGNEFSNEDIEILANNRAFRGTLAEGMDNPTLWRKAFEGVVTLPELPPNPTYEVEQRNESVRGTPTSAEKTSFFETRLDLARVFFNLAVHKEIYDAMAIAQVGSEAQKREIIEIYDPTSLNDIDGALRRLAFEGEPETQSLLHSCYPDLELPTYHRNPLAIAPDFYYRRDVRVNLEAMEVVEKRLDSLFNLALKNLPPNVQDSHVMKEMPEEVASSIRGYLLSRKYPELTQQIANVGKSTSFSAEGILQLASTFKDAQGNPLQEPTDAEVREQSRNMEASEYSDVPVNTMIASKRLALLLRIAALQDIINAPSQILEKEVPEDSLLRYRRQQAELVQQFNLMPQIIQGGLIQGMWGTLTPSNVQRNFLFLRNAMRRRLERARSDESAGSLARVFPTVKVYFIEEDAKEWGMLDDYYGYQAVRSVQVVASKDSASRVATLQVSNITQKLTDQRFVFGESVGRDQTSQEQNLQSFVLREGMTIMIRMGYSSNPNLLDRVFMGKVVSVSPGDTIQIVAQSFGAELTGPIFNGEEVSIGYSNSSARSLGDVLVQSLSNMDGLDHFGNRSWLEILHARIPKFGNIPEFKAYNNPKYRSWDYYKALINPINKLLQFGVYDPRLENAYLPFTGNIYSAVQSLTYMSLRSALVNVVGGQTSLGTVLRLAGTAVSGANKDVIRGFTNNPTFDWYIPPATSMWKLLQEMALYFNDYIVTVLPYNDNKPGAQRETIYIGPRNGLYKYTEVFDSEETAKTIFAKNKNTGLNDYMIDIKNPDHLVNDQQQPLPGYMPVVNYHWIDSHHDIIENAITASAENIHNKVTIRFPGEPSAGFDEEFTVVADDNIKEGNIRHLVSIQPNIDPAPFEDFYKSIVRPAASQGANVLRRIFAPASSPILANIELPAKYMVAANVLAQEMAKMYTGVIKIWGRPSIKPYDVVYLNDQDHQMFGPVEVAEVIHDFNPETGFTTTIVPNAIISIRDQSHLYHNIAMNGMTIPYINTSLTGIPSLIPKLILQNPSRAAAIALDASNPTAAVTSTLSPGNPLFGTVGFGAVIAVGSLPFITSLWSKGLGQIMGRDIINVTGLFQNSVPLVAGLEGAYKDSYRVHIEDKVRNMVTFSANVETFRSTLEFR